MSDYSPDETPTQIFSEKMWLQGALITAVGYGSVLTLFVFAAYLTFTTMDRWNKRQNTVLLVYISAQFILATLFQASTAKFTQLAFIENRNYPGGPGAYEIDFFNIPIDTLGNATYVISNWLSDLLLLWRGFVIYRNCRYPVWAVMLIPFLAFLANIGIGTLYLIQVSASSPFLSGSTNFTIITASLSFAINLTLTLMIVIRLMLYRYRMRRFLGHHQGAEYVSIAAMLIESATLYAAFSLFFIIPFGLNSPVENIPFQALSQVQIIAPFLIIVRVSQGKAWSSDTARSIMTPAGSGSVTLRKMRYTSQTDMQPHDQKMSTTDVNKSTITGITAVAEV